MSKRDQHKKEKSRRLKKKEKSTLKKEHKFSHIEHDPNLYCSLKEEGLKNHPSLLNIIELDDDRFVREEELLYKFGYDNFQLIRFQESESEKYIDSTNKDGGFTLVLVDKSDENCIRTLVFIKQWWRSILDRKKQLPKFGNSIAVLHHELGHVHDVENRVNIIIDPPIIELLEVDFFKAEFYAHNFACNQLSQKQQWLILDYYLTDLLGQIIKEKSSISQKAASEFQKSTEYKKHIKRLREEQYQGA